MRFPLSPRKKAPVPIEIHVWDIETKTEPDGTLVPFLVGFSNRGGYKSFRGERCVYAFVSHVFQSLDSDSVVWSHNGGGFDHLFLISALLDNSEFEISTALSGSSAILVWVRHRPTDKTLVFMDSMRVFLSSLRKIAESLWPNGGMRKGNIDLSNEPIESTRWVEYNATDCLILQKALEYTQAALNRMGGNLRLTGGASAIDLFQRRYLDVELWPASYEQHEKLFRASMYGGRTEPFDMRRIEKAKTYDINSLYPYACTQPLPWKFRQYGTDKVLNECTANPDDLVGFAEVRVEVPRVHIPPLPVKRHKLIFPTGTFEGVWTTADLVNLRRVGGKVLSVKQCVSYHAKPIAREMMQTLFEARHTADKTPEGRALVAGGKLVANSWYGKLGQRPDKEQFRFRPDADWLIEAEAKGERWTPHDASGVLYKRAVTRHQPHMLPHIAAHITALARQRHYADLLNIGTRTIYCDTDSIITTADLPTGVGLGEWKLEQEWEWFQVFLPKLYHGSVGGKIITKAKGFGGWNKADYVDGIVAHLTAGGGVKVSAPSKLKSMLKHASMKPHERTVTKHVRSTYDKRVVHEDGTTSPHHLEE